jgi:hypothetical protein
MGHRNGLPATSAGDSLSCLKGHSMNEHDTIVLTRPLPEHGLQAGNVGVIVHVYAGEKGFEVEFVAGSGSTVAVVTLAPDDIRTVATSEILHVRKIPA